MRLYVVDVVATSPAKNICSLDIPWIDKNGLNICELLLWLVDVAASHRAPLNYFICIFDNFQQIRNFIRVYAKPSDCLERPKYVCHASKACRDGSAVCRLVLVYTIWKGGV